MMKKSYGTCHMSRVAIKVWQNRYPAGRERWEEIKKRYDRSTEGKEEELTEEQKKVLELVEAEKGNDDEFGRWPKSFTEKVAKGYKKKKRERHLPRAKKRKSNAILRIKKRERQLLRPTKRVS